MDATRTQSDDTSPEAERVLIDRYRRLDLHARLRLAFDQQEVSDAFALCGIRMRHPQADEREQKLRLAALKIERELMLRAYGWDPLEKGY